MMKNTDILSRGVQQPQARDLEEAILGNLMLKKDFYALVSEILTPQSFYDETNKLIYIAIQDLARKPEQAIDMLTVIEQLKSNGTLEAAGGVSRIKNMTQGSLPSESVKSYSEIIARKFLAREVISFSYDLYNKAFDESIDIFNLMQTAEADLFKLAYKNIKKSLTAISDEEIDELGKNKKEGVPSGFTELDEITLGWQKSNLIIIAGRTSVGKTTLALTMAKNMAVDHNIPIAFFSLEMSRRELTERLASNIADIRADVIRKGELMSDDRNLIKEKLHKDNDTLFIDDTEGLSVLELRTKARRAVKEHQIQCIIIDYLQLMITAGETEAEKFKLREQEVAYISRSLKSLAKELEIPVIALSQLNRNPEMRVDKRPELFDLRESGAIEQDADVVCFIHKRKVRETEEEKYQLLVAKHRNGPTKDIDITFDKNKVRIENGMTN